MDDITQKQISEDGELDVMLAPVGTFTAQSASGGLVEENLTEESLVQLANKTNEAGADVLMDRDHASCRPGLDRNTEALGWFKKFWANAKGLFGRLKLTQKGREAVEDRQYRFLSPVFSLDGKGQPIELHSVAATNTPNFTDNEPMLNHQPINTNRGELTMNMTKEELVQLIKDTVADMEKAEEAVDNACSEEKPKAEETAENACSDETKNEEPMTEEVKEEVKEETTTEEVKTEEAKTEEVKEEPKEEAEEEVIKIEAVNSAPIPKAPQDAEWKFLRGDAFWKYLREHPETK